MQRPRDWPPPSARSLLGPTGYKTKVYVQYYVDRYPHPVTDGEGHSIEDCLLQANRMILAQRDPFQARRIRIEEQENLGEKTAVVIFRHGPRRVIPTELVGRAMMKLYNMVHQYESVKQWRGLRFGSIYLRDETDRLLGYIAWDLENQP